MSVDASKSSAQAPLVNSGFLLKIIHCTPHLHAVEFYRASIGLSNNASPHRNHQAAIQLPE